jgi:hypothetical protein
LFVWDNIFAVGKDGGRERVFFAAWELITQALDFRGSPITDGYCMSIAAAVTGWRPADAGLELIDATRRHAGISSAMSSERSFCSGLKRFRQWYLWRRYRNDTTTRILR